MCGGGLRTQECVCTTFLDDCQCGPFDCCCVVFGIMVFCVNVFLFKKWFRLFLRVMILVLFAKFFVEGSILAQDERWRRA